MNNMLIIAIEEQINLKNLNGVQPLFKYDTQVLEIIQSRLKRDAIHQSTLYEDITIFIKKLNDSRFIRYDKTTMKETIRDSRFYNYACIDDSTWNEIKKNKITPSKKTLLKLIIALKLNHQEAEEILQKCGKKLDPNDIQDQIISAILDLWDTYALDVRDVEDILFDYQAIYKDTKPFECIYQIK